VFTLLREDHEKVLAMLDELEQRGARPAPHKDNSASGHDLAMRQQRVTELVIAASGHEAVEEQFFWPTVQKSLPDGEQLASHAINQEQSAKRLLEDIERANPREAEFETMVRQIISDGREHISYEETQVWPKLREALSAEEAEQLGEKMAQAKKTAPTRPHADTPPQPGVLKTAGMAAAAMDRMRDSLTGRGKR
jgi:hemerythrin superfamily protein